MLEGDTDVNSIGGLELGAVPIVAAVCAQELPSRPVNGFVVRKEKKGHGTDQKIDGNFKPNTTVVLIEDVTTKGGSVMQAVNAVRAQGATVKKIHHHRGSSGGRGGEPEEGRARARADLYDQGSLGLGPVFMSATGRRRPSSASFVRCQACPSFSDLTW